MCPSSPLDWTLKPVLELLERLDYSWHFLIEQQLGDERSGPDRSTARGITIVILILILRAQRPVLAAAESSSSSSSFDTTLSPAKYRYEKNIGSALRRLRARLTRPARCT
jgi:hypothetical protein